MASESLLQKDGDDNVSCFASLFGWMWRKRVPTTAETVSMLQQTMINLKLQMEHAESQSDKKKRTAAELYRKGKKDLALRAMTSAKRYDKIYAAWFNMCETVEEISSQLQMQQQSVVIFDAYVKADKAFESMAKKLDLSDLTNVLDSLRDKMDAGAEASEILGSELSKDQFEMDDQELQRELEKFLDSRNSAAADQNPEKIFTREGHVTLPQTINQKYNSNNEQQQQEQHQRKQQQEVYYN